MPSKRRRGHFLSSTHVDLGDDLKFITRRSRRIPTAREEDEILRQEKRRRELESETLLQTRFIFEMLTDIYQSFEMI